MPVYCVNGNIITVQPVGWEITKKKIDFSVGTVDLSDAGCPLCCTAMAVPLTLRITIKIRAIEII